MTLTALDLDLEVFSGPFDLLLALLLREEIDLLDVELAEIVVAYLDHLEARGELDLEAATEFIVLIAALLELKSRLLLPGEEEEPLELEPGEAAEELLERMLEAHRFRGAGEDLAKRLAAQPAVRYREAPLPPALRRRSLEDVTGPLWDADMLAQAVGGLLAHPPPIDVRHIRAPHVNLGERLAHLRALLRGSAGAVSFDDAVLGADRMTVAVTLFALLELYKRGEADWRQPEPFGELTIHARQSDRGAAGRAVALAMAPAGRSEAP